MNRSPRFRVHSPCEVSAKFGREMYDDVQFETLNLPAGTGSRTVSVENPYQDDSRFAKAPAPNLYNNVTPDHTYPIIEEYGSNQHSEASAAVTSANAFAVGRLTRTPVLLFRESQGPKRPGRRGRLQCEPCRKQKKGVEVSAHLHIWLNLVYSTSNRIP